MKTPIDDMNKCLAILILDSVGCSQDEIAGILHCGKLIVGNVEKWFKELQYEKSVSFCHEQAVKNAFWMQIIPSDQELSRDKLACAAQITNDYILMHYGKRHRKQPEQHLLIPRSQQHYAYLTDAAGKLRQNIKQVKGAKSDLIGNITQGYTQTSKARESKQPLQNVDRLDAECLLSHLITMYPEFKAIKNWEELTTRKSVSDISNDMLKKLRVINRGIALEGTCEICRSWYPEEQEEQ